MKMLRTSAWFSICTVLFLAFTAFAVNAADLPRVAPAISQLAKMHDAGVSEDVMLAYVQNSSMPKPNADELIYLHEAGVSKNVITTLLSRRDAAVQTQAAAPEPVQAANSEPVLAKPEYAKQQPSGPTVVMQQEPRQATSTVIVHPAPPRVVLAPPALETYYLGPNYYPYYPYYSRPWYGYGPTFSIGFGFGNHWGGGHHGWHGGGGHGGWHGGGHGGWHR
jgi:hypothetical protein